MAAPEDITAFLESYRGRDKIVRLLNYGCYVIAGLSRRLCKKRMEGKMTHLADQLSNIRVLLRFFDDFAMLRFSVGYGVGKSEKNLSIRAFKVMKNVLDQCFYPVEHIAWLCDHKIIKGDSSRLWILSTVLWLLSCLLDIVIALRSYIMLRMRSSERQRTLEHQVTAESWKADYIAIQKEKHRTECGMKHLQATMIGSFCDAMNAVNWLPEGFLWANKFPLELVGLLGVVSTSCMLYKVLHPVG